MLKMKIDPTMCMKKKARVTQCHVIEPTFWPKMHGLRGNSGRKQSVVWRKAAFRAAFAEETRNLPFWGAEADA
jgi:hypothetical protein